MESSTRKESVSVISLGFSLVLSDSDDPDDEDESLELDDFFEPRPRVRAMSHLTELHVGHAVSSENRS